VEHPQQRQQQQTGTKLLGTKIIGINKDNKNEK
jgi:hypothetical protein